MLREVLLDQQADVDLRLRLPQQCVPLRSRATILTSGTDLIGRRRLTFVHRRLPCVRQAAMVPPNARNPRTLSP